MTEIPSNINDRIQKELNKKKVAKLFQIAEKYGVVKRGFTAIQYLRYAIKNYGWESHAITETKEAQNPTYSSKEDSPSTKT
jgi:hypothetical protein